MPSAEPAARPAETPPPAARARAAGVRDKLRDLLEDPQLKVETNGRGLIRIEIDLTTADRLVAFLQREGPWQEV